MTSSCIRVFGLSGFRGFVVVFSPGFRGFGANTFINLSIAPARSHPSSYFGQSMGLQKTPIRELAVAPLCDRTEKHPPEHWR